jgi:altronate dehydratase
MATYALTEKAVVLRPEDDVAVAKAELIFEEVISVASGKRSKSELSGVGEEELAP